MPCSFKDTSKRGSRCGDAPRSRLKIGLRCFEKSPKLLLLGVLLASLLLKLNHLDHSRFGGLDEACHAVVSKNLLKHPLKPTLIDTPYLHYFEAGWGGNHIWLHKPTLPMWQSAVSMAILGINTFAVRLPSALLSTLAVWLTYLIGVELLTRRAALIAATAQAFSWFIMRVVQGYLFSDMMDISLLFYTQLGIYGVMRCVKTGQWRFVVLAGVGQGCAFLSKTYPAFIVTGVSLAGWLAPSLALAKREDCHLRGRHVLGLLGVTAIVALPWTLFTVMAYPIEFNLSNRVTFSHFTEDLQGWGAPWYQVFFYTGEILNFLTVPTLIAIFWALPRLFRERNIGLCLLYAWGVGVFPPFLIATTKIPCATLMGAPALLLLFGDFVDRTTHRNTDDARWHRRLRVGWTVLLVFLFLCEGVDAWWVTHFNKTQKSLTEIAAYVEENLPANAVLLIEEAGEKQHQDHDYLLMMFLTTRTAYPYSSEHPWKPMSQRIQHRGGIPYILTFRALNLPVVFKSQTATQTLYSVPNRTAPSPAHR